MCTTISSFDNTPSVKYDHSQSEIFKLKIDNFEEIFDCLSLKDLAALGQTCYRMRGYVGYYIKTNYAATRFVSRSDGFYIDNNTQFDGIKFNGLSSFLKNIVFHHLEQYEGFIDIPTGTIIPHMEADGFKSLKEIRLKPGVVITTIGISRINEILNQVKTVKLDYPKFIDSEAEFYESFLKYCTAIKRLCILGKCHSPIVGTDNSWLYRKYPKLEHFVLTAIKSGPIDELKTFFEQNTNIHSFATNIEMIMANRDVFKMITPKWNVLSIKFKCRNTLNLDARDFLIELYTCGLFKKLHVSLITSFIIDHEIANYLASLKFLEKISIDGVFRYEYMDLTPIVHLKQLCIFQIPRVNNMKMLVEKLVNLEFVQFTFVKFDDILPFVRHSPKLTKIVVYRLMEFDENMLNIEELNKERSKLVNARKVTMFVQEHIYLAAKWAKNQTNCSFIEIKRGSSYDAINHSFDYTSYYALSF